MQRLKLSLGLTGSGARGARIQSGFTYTRGADDSIKIFLTSARGGGVADALELTAFNVNSTENFDIVTEAAISPELADTPTPGALLNASGVKVTSMTSVAANTLYLISYTVVSKDPATTLFLNDLGPFDFAQIPSAVGDHRILVTTEDAGTGVAISKGQTGAMTVSNMSIKRAEWNANLALLDAGDEIDFAITRGDLRPTTGTAVVPVAGEFYVAPSGSDTRGTGAEATPFATPAKANALKGPGDMVFLRPGTYAPFVPTGTGPTDDPVTFTTLPGEEHLAIIEGDLITPAGPLSYTSVWDAPETPQEATRDGIYILAQDNIRIRNLTIRNVWRAGVFIVGETGEQHGGHIVENCRIYHTGGSSIIVNGQRSDTLLPIGETPDTDMRTDDILIEKNDCSFAQVITRYNNNTENSQGIPGGVGECITITTGVSNFIVRNNDVHDSRQYGIDTKAGVVNGAVYGNRIWNMERYGLYADAGARFVNNVDFYDNIVINCQMGMVAARERGDENTNVSLIVRGWNNLILNTRQIGIYAQIHPGDDGANGVFTVNWRFNTVFNADRDGGFRDVRLDTPGALTGSSFIGNLIDSDAAISILEGWTADDGATVADNFNFANGTGTDPLFVNPDVTFVPPTTHRGPITIGDYTLANPSPAENIVDAIYVDGVFQIDASGNGRDISDDADAGALALNTTTAVILGPGATIQDNGDGTRTVTVTDPAGYAGTYTVTDVQIDSGLPIELVAAVITESPTDTFTATPGYWLNPTEDPPVITQVFARNGVTVATGNSYTLVGADAGQEITYRETATNNEGAVLGTLRTLQETSALEIAREFVTTFGQDDNFNSGVANSETTAAVFPSAGTHLLTVSSITSGITPPLIVTGSAVSSATLVYRQQLNSTADVTVEGYIVVATGASDLTLGAPSSSTGNNFYRIGSVEKLTNADTSTIISATALGNQGNTFTASLADVESGMAVFAVACVRDGGSGITGISIGGSFSGEGTFYTGSTFSGNIEAAGAAFVATTGGTFTAPVTITGADAAYRWGIALIGIKPATA